MIENIGLATKSEIEEELKASEAEFNECKFIMGQNLERMKELSEYYNKLLAQKNKMEGVTDGNGQ